MDVFHAIRELTEERDRLDALIAILEAHLEIDSSSNSGPAKSKRGRKAMNSAERLKVSERMRRYWATRRENSTS